MTLSPLIERLTAATGPDREIDAEISAQTRIGTRIAPSWAYRNFPEWRARTDGRVELVHANGNGGPHFESPRFTGSLDAALTLIPKPWRLIDLHQLDNVDLWHAGVRIPGMEVGTDDACPSAAIALCIAALKARSQEGARG